MMFVCPKHGMFHDGKFCPVCSNLDCLIITSEERDYYYKKYGVIDISGIENNLKSHIMINDKIVTR